MVREWARGVFSIEIVCIMVFGGWGLGRREGRVGGRKGVKGLYRGRGFCFYYYFVTAYGIISLFLRFILDVVFVVKRF